MPTAPGMIVVLAPCLPRLQFVGLATGIRAFLFDTRKERASLSPAQYRRQDWNPAQGKETYHAEISHAATLRTGINDAIWVGANRLPRCSRSICTAFARAR